MKFGWTESGGEFQAWLPKEQDVESLAARLRPLLLADDPVHYGKAFASFGALLSERTLSTKVIRAHRKRWERLDRGRATRFEIQQYAAQDGQVERTWHDRVIADAWFYGDLVHADSDKRAATRNLSPETRFQAAFAFCADVVELLWVSIGLVFICRRSLALPEWAWSTPVSIETSGGWWKRPADAYIADSGTAVPSGELGDQWQKLGPEPPESLRHLGVR